MDQWKSDRKQLHDYHTEVLKKNKEKEIEEKEVRAKLFQARLLAAKENAEKYHKTKADERAERDQEKAQFSPMNTRTKAFAEPASPEVIIPEAAAPQTTAEHFNTLKAPTPQYDDFLNDLFAKKRHQAYKRSEAVEKRTEAIQQKFTEQWTNAGQVAFDSKIHQAYKKQNEEFSATMDERKTTRDRIAQETKEFQKKQMKDKAVMGLIKGKQAMTAYEKEQMRLAK